VKQQDGAGMNEIPLFDCAAHPTLTGGWLRPQDGHANTFDRLIKEMDRANVAHAVAFGMAGVGGYEAGAYIREAQRFGERLVPVAFCDFAEIKGPRDAAAYLGQLRSLGYCGIKIHPRLSAVQVDDPRVLAVVLAAAELGMVVMICTYPYEASIRSLCNGVEHIARLLFAAPHARVVLMHGGDVRLMEMASFVRHLPGSNVLLDLSFTMCKYKGSSVDLDVRFLFENFDRRICIGSDSPEFSLDVMRERFDFFAHGLPGEKIRNIANLNLSRFLGRA
jgi:predicted TIM-barrel fold metal-dependent hydrolase